MFPFDELHVEESIDQAEKWLGQFADPDIVKELVRFVNERRKPGAAAAVAADTNQGRLFAMYRGAHYTAARIKFDHGSPDMIIKFANKGIIAFRDEKVFNDVQMLKMIAEQTTIPVPCVVDWGYAKDSPGGLGPFIIMEYVEGIRLTDILVPPPDSVADDSEPSDEILDQIYRQIATVLVKLFMLDFDKLGAGVQNHKDNSETLTVSSRPYTRDDNTLITMCGFPPEEMTVTPFKTTESYIAYLTNQHLINVRTQRNAAITASQAHRRFAYRRVIQQLAPAAYYYDGNLTNEVAGRFKLHCDCWSTDNIIMDTVTNPPRIKAVLGFGFCNVVPYQFAADPPFWLFDKNPRSQEPKVSSKLDDFEAWQRKVWRFLRAIEWVERWGDDRFYDMPPQRLSQLMRWSWTSTQHIFNLAVRRSSFLDQGIEKGHLDTFLYWLVEKRMGEQDALAQKLQSAFPDGIPRSCFPYKYVDYSVVAYHLSGIIKSMEGQGRSRHIVTYDNSSTATMEYILTHHGKHDAVGSSRSQRAKSNKEELWFKVFQDSDSHDDVEALAEAKVVDFQNYLELLVSKLGIR